MKTTDFAESLSNFLKMHLPGQRNVSENTVKSYRDTFKLVLVYAEEKLGIPSERLSLQQFDCDFVSGFLAWLETDRKNSVSTRNQRLAAIRSFIGYIKNRKPEYLYQSQQILAMASLKSPEPMLEYLQPDDIQAILAKPKISTRYGRRDAVLLSLLYDSAARVQELADLQVGDVRLVKPYTVILTGKGNKTRAVPLMDATAELLKKYVAENRLDTLEKLGQPMFCNHQRNILTRAGIAYILKKYCDQARSDRPLIPMRVSPHVLRHSRAMHMLQAGINLIYIRDFLGHAHVTTTEIYARADTEMKRAAIESAHIRVEPDLPDWAQDKSLMEMLADICGNN
mgnify:CR=1 FL=1